MRNICSVFVVLLIMFTASVAMAAGTRKQVQPGHAARVNCQRELGPPKFDSYGNEVRGPGYANSFEEDRRRQEAGPDEVEDRNPEDRSAIDPGGF